jgi:hypothetical protein
VPELNTSRLTALLDQRYDDLLAAWIAEQLQIVRRGQISESDLRAQCVELLQAIRRGLSSGGSTNLAGQSWAAARVARDAVRR